MPSPPDGKPASATAGVCPAITAAGRLNESDAVRARLAEVALSAQQRERALARARDLVAGCRARTNERSTLDLFLREFGLSNEEGIALMCISEALLRIPDEDTAEALVAEKIASANWERHLGHSDSLFLNASTWALMLTGGVIALGEDVTADVGGWVGRLAGRVGESVARAAMSRAVRILGAEFVRGRTIEEALARGGGLAEATSFDMLGEGARTFEDAARYLDAYRHAIRVVGDAAHERSSDSASPRPAISVKLSALHPRFEPLQAERIQDALGGTLLGLAKEAAERNLLLTIDAEEAERLELSLRLFEHVAHAPELADWDGLGLAVQAYSKRAPAVIDWLATLERPLHVRLVKGAYWDFEIKRAQVEGLASYPVYTRKAFTDVAYLACAARLFQARHLQPHFATHNAHTIAAVLELGGQANKAYEFQRLHGMGELLYDEARRRVGDFPPVRVYAPVGPHKELLGYLVRRLLENGANSSFVNRFLDDAVPLTEVVRDPLALAEADTSPHPRIPLPSALFGEVRRNSRGIDVGDGTAVGELLQEAHGQREQLSRQESHDPAALVREAADACGAWNATAASARRACLARLADLIETNRARFVALLAQEAGKTLQDAVAEVREAADFCRYYGAECERLFAAPTVLPGPTGESNTLALHGRGVFVCISPWNFPLAIFTGQVAAALAAGNTVVAKPAPQTPAVAAAVVELMIEAGIPTNAVRLAPGGAQTGADLVAAQGIAGVAFTGSFATAKRIERALAAKDAPIVPFIAETGGQNAMLVDSTALPEQAVDDIVTSAFRSAGQRCSALRVLYVQEDIADTLIPMLIGAMQALVIGDPAHPATDVGPVIDATALATLCAHIDAMRSKRIHQCAVRPNLHGHYIGPALIEIDTIADLDAEHFGPILHLVRYKAADFERILEEIQATGDGLTLGVHSRIARRAETVIASAPAGNAYVNRDMIGAVVGVQPFGGEGLSGTGPKAGGPNYLPRFAVERAVTWNTVATGGNAALLRLG